MRGVEIQTHFNWKHYKIPYIRMCKETYTETYKVKIKFTFHLQQHLQQHLYITFLLHPTPLLVQAYIKFVRMHATPRRFEDKPSSYYADVFRISLSLCLPVLLFCIQPTTNNVWDSLPKFSTRTGFEPRTEAFGNGSDRTTFSSTSYITLY